MLPSPNEFGLPEKYSKWRPNQAEAVLSILKPQPRFLLQVAPTGSGKSGCAIAAGQLSPERTIILTSTKGLQTQYIQDFGEMDGVVDIRGRGNYPCRLNTKVSCDAGLCAFGVSCTMKSEGGCFYFDRLREAKKAKIVITNYSYWMSQNEYSDGIGKFGLMILDEAHMAYSHVLDHIAVSFSKQSKTETQLLGLNGSLPNTAEAWAEWAEERVYEVDNAVNKAKTERREKLFIQLKRLLEKLKRLQERINPTWIWEDNSSNVILSPIWPLPYTETVLFLGIPKVVLTSATIVPKTLKLLTSSTDVEFVEYPHSFPVENRPLIHTPTVKINYKAGEYEEKIWLTKLDNLIRDRIGRKGIIHTVSYKRRDLVLERSKYREYMITHNNTDTESVVRTFKTASAPCILVSPSMATGWDFPADELRWQIIVKLPFPDIQGTIVRARMKQDDDFAAYLAMQQLIQATGRGCRSEEDWCESLILDNNIEWFLKKYTHLSVEWFKGAYRVCRMLPKPLNNNEQQNKEEV